MELKMKIGKEMIDAVVLNPAKVRDEQYLSSLKAQLQLKHGPTIRRLQKQPMFYIEVKTDFRSYP